MLTAGPNWASKPSYTAGLTAWRRWAGRNCHSLSRPYYPPATSNSSYVCFASCNQIQCDRRLFFSNFLGGGFTCLCVQVGLPVRVMLEMRLKYIITYKVAGGLFVELSVNYYCIHLFILKLYFNTINAILTNVYWLTMSMSFCRWSYKRLLCNNKDLLVFK